MTEMSETTTKPNEWDTRREFDELCDYIEAGTLTRLQLNDPSLLLRVRQLLRGAPGDADYLRSVSQLFERRPGTAMRLRAIAHRLAPNRGALIHDPSP